MAGALIAGFLFAYVTLLKNNTGNMEFISLNPPDVSKLSYIIPFCSVDLQYVILFVAIFSLMLLIIFILTEFNNGNTKMLFSLLPIDYSDIAVSNILISGSRVALVTLCAALPYIIVYGIKVFGLLSPVLLPRKLKLLILLYYILFPFIILLVSFVISEIIEILLIILYALLPDSRRKLTIVGSSALLNLIVVLLFTMFGFEIWNSIKTVSQNSVFVKIYGYFPISYVTRSIIDITRPVPNTFFTFKVASALLFLSIILFVCIVLLSLFSDLAYGYCSSGNQTYVANNSDALRKANAEGFSIIKALPVFVKTDLYNFTRKGKTFKWLINSLFTSLTIAVAFILPGFASGNADRILHINLFGANINYFALLILVISVTQLAQLAIYVFNYEKAHCS